MHAHLSPESAADPGQLHEQDALRALNRSPHPYHHQSSELPHLSDRFQLRNGAAQSNGPRDEAKPSRQASRTAYPAFSKESTPGSESGTEADDEHFLKGLPAPRTKLHKGLRGLNEPLSGISTPLLSPAILEHDVAATKAHLSHQKPAKRRVIDVLRRKKNLVRRATEAGLVTTLGCLVKSNGQVSPLAAAWGKGMSSRS